MDTVAVTGPVRATAPASRARGVPWWWLPLAVFLASRVVDAALIMLAARHQVAVPGAQPGLPPTSVDPATYGHVVASWDGGWYRTIVEHGYPGTLPRVDGVVQQNAWAFYPLYPAVVWLVMALSPLSFGVAASLVSIACAGAATCLLYRMIERTASRFTALLTVLALSTFAAAPILQAAYTESAALLLVLASLWCLREQRYAALLATALLLSLTRPVVLPLALVIGLHWLARWRRRADHPFPPRQRVVVAGVALAAAASAFIWPAVVAVATGEPDGYLATRQAWINATGVEGWPSWLAILLGHHSVATAVLMLGAVAALAVVLLRPSARLWGTELRLWAFAYPLYLLGSSRPTPSVFRYAVLAVVPWWPFPEVGEQVTSRGGRVALCAAVVAFGVVGQFFWIRWFFVVTPHAIGYP